MTIRKACGEKKGRLSLQKVCAIFIAVMVLFAWGFYATAAPLPRLGPVDISGFIDDVCWIPKTVVKGIPDMSGSAGRDRAFAPHFRVKLTDFSGVDAATAIAMTRYVDWNALKNHEGKKKPPFVLLKIDYPNKNFLKKGMKIKAHAYVVGGDEGGTWTSFRQIEILNNASGDDSIRRYLENTLESPGFGGKMFCTYELYGKEMKGDKQHLYLWTFCMEYYAKQGFLQEGAGVSMPVVLVSLPSCHGDLIETHFKPVDGEDYGNSIRAIFPPQYHKAIFAWGEAYNKRAETLQRAARQNARTYYNVEW
jgi:hypothetical protein